MAKKVANSGVSMAVFLLLALLWTSSATALTADDVSKYIYGFRKDNQFSLLLSFSTREWHLRQDDSFNDRNLAVHFVYRFQLQLAKNFGYYLGTRLGFRYSLPASRRNFYALLLPGAAAGFIWYANAQWQTLLGMEAFLERVPSLPTLEGGDAPGLSLASYAVVLTAEHYFNLNTAAVAVLAVDLVRHELQRKDHAKIANLQRQGVRLALGVNYHLL